ncbi:hypothetical protein ACLKMH_12135 [Psychromonas sp. KJ10-10]|uniref:hypothetical protein n=1 Tax=Psychromonas sp. KJ10-10 TaxID=3391823 RepID=UPI0039B644EB
MENNHARRKALKQLGGLVSGALFSNYTFAKTEDLDLPSCETGTLTKGGWRAEWSISEIKFIPDSKEFYYADSSFINFSNFRKNFFVTIYQESRSFFVEVQVPTEFVYKGYQYLESDGDFYKTLAKDATIDENTAFDEAKLKLVLDRKGFVPLTKDVTFMHSDLSSVDIFFDSSNELDELMSSHKEALNVSIQLDNEIIANIALNTKAIPSLINESSPLIKKQQKRERV